MKLYHLVFFAVLAGPLKTGGLAQTADQEALGATAAARVDLNLSGLRLAADASGLVLDRMAQDGGRDERCNGAAADWGAYRLEASYFLSNNVRGNVTPAIRQAILDAGQSPVARELMEKYLMTTTASTKLHKYMRGAPANESSPATLGI